MSICIVEFEGIVLPDEAEQRVERAIKQIVMDEIAKLNMTDKVYVTPLQGLSKVGGPKGFFIGDKEKK